VKLRTLMLIAAVTGLTLFVPIAASGTVVRPFTTEPEEYDIVDVTITDSRIILSDKTFERGNGIDFRVKNVGKKVHNFRLVAVGQTIIGLDRQGLGVGMLKSGQTGVLQVYLDARGVYGYRSTARIDRAKPGMHGKLSVL
jgi:hypothetical protein